MKIITILTFIFLSINGFSSERETASTKKKKWKKIQDTISATIEKSKRSEHIKFNTPVFESNIELDSNSLSVTGAEFN